MPILDLQRQLRRLGKIRMGDQQATQSGKSRPAKLTEWRLTSPSLELLEAAAQVYGGEVGPWDNAPGEATQYQLYTTSDTLDIIVPPAGALSQWYEMWSGGGCQRRCDGVTEQLTGESCMCPADADLRRTEAAKGKACKITTRLSVILPNIPDIGMWMLECHGYYGAVELAGAEEILRMANANGRMVPARLRIDQRTQKRANQTQHYIVPVIELPTLTAGTLMTGEVPSPALGGGAERSIGSASPAAAPPAPKALPVAAHTRPPEMSRVEDTKPLPEAKPPKRARPPLPSEAPPKKNPYAEGVHIMAAEVAKATDLEAGLLADLAVSVATGGTSTSANDLTRHTKDVAVLLLAEVRDGKVHPALVLGPDGSETYRLPDADSQPTLDGAA